MLCICPLFPLPWLALKDDDRQAIANQFPGTGPSRTEAITLMKFGAIKREISLNCEGRLSESDSMIGPEDFHEGMYLLKARFARGHRD
jgi:hypothetical protein